VLKNFVIGCNNCEAAEAILQQTGIAVDKIRRLHYRDTNKQLPIAVVHCKTSEDQVKLFSSNLVLGNKKVSIHPYKNKKSIPTRCYRCQKFGHIAATCRKEERCEYCAEKHTGKCNRIKNSKCVNCGGVHAASSNKCPVFIDWCSKLAARNNQ